MKSWLTRDNLSVIKLLGMRSNVFLVSDGRLNILVDTSPSIFRRILEKRLRSLNITRIDYLILTHTHFDHTGNAKWIRDNYMAKVIVHRSEEAFLAEGMSSLPAGTNFFTRPLMRNFGLKATKKMSYDPCPADFIVDDRFDLEDLGINAYILHTPGHSAGSMSVVVGNEIAIVGDAMVGTFPGMIFPPFADDVPEMIRSWGKLLQSGCRIFLPSHGSANSRELLEREAGKRAKK
jgi:glyoxylase-like metal-dependent hydrolase (beta-lactamase superfamily II)